MNEDFANPVVPAARYSSRLALFSACLLMFAIVLHRFSALTTPVALNVFGVALAGAAIAYVFGLYAVVRIWRLGERGALRAATGILVAVVMLAWPVTYALLHWRLPGISDVTTDTQSPPRFNVLAKRPAGANRADYPGAAAARAQTEAYPDLHTFVLDRPVEEAFELVEEALRKLRWRVAASEAPVAKPPKAGLIEASDQTLLIGFWDDVAIRVEGSAARSRIDIRSASRYGAFDFGQNAARIRRFLAELQARVDASTPSAIAGRRSLRTTRTGVPFKKGSTADQPKGSQPAAADRAQPNAQRARAPKETPR